MSEWWNCLTEQEEWAVIWLFGFMPIWMWLCSRYLDRTVSWFGNTWISKLYRSLPRWTDPVIGISALLLGCYGVYLLSGGLYGAMECAL